jgi:hypothetical protein
VEVSGSADFGSISGHLFEAVDHDGSAAGSDQSTFGDFLTILGGTGQGTLITHYQIISSGQQDREPFVPLAAFYRFLQGNTIIEHSPALPAPLARTPDVSRLSEDLDVTSLFTFGVPLPLAAGMRIPQPLSGPGGTGSVSTSSSAQITGFTVLDSSGGVVADATIQRSFSTTPPDPFVPEPGTLAMMVTGGVLLILLRRRG